MNIEKLIEIKDKLTNLTKLPSAYSDNSKYKTIIENMITTCDMKISLLEINKLDCSKKKNILGDISNLYFITDDNKENLKRFDEDKYQQIIKFIHNETFIKNALWESGLESMSGCSSDDQSNQLPHGGIDSAAAAATDAIDKAAANAMEAIFNKDGGGKRRKKKMRSKSKSKTHKTHKTKSKRRSKTKSKRRSKRRSKISSKKR